MALRVAFVVRSCGFPHGMATSSRLRLLGKALAERGAEVTVLVTRASEPPEAPLNHVIRGLADGIPFVYTSGTTLRSPSFLMRRAREARGFVGALVELARLRRKGQLDCAYLSLGAGSWEVGLSLWAWSLYFLRVPFVVELNEHPWRISRRPAPFARWTSQLAAAAGAVAISSHLAQWSTREAERIDRAVAILEVPIILDVGEHVVGDFESAQPTLVYSASNAYAAALSFILHSMTEVWSQRPDCRLVVTGMEPKRAANVVSELELAGHVQDGRITLAGYLPRQELGTLTAQASALLAPLFDDLASRARFPTKLGEYLASGRPVVTNPVGEIDRFLRDGDTAFMSPAGDVTAYAARILDVLNDTVGARTVGRAGRRLAEEKFDYRLQGPRLYAFLEEIATLATPEERWRPNRPRSLRRTH
jgi:hypothetical protein